MMSLRYLFDNEELARMLVGNWEYDPASLDLFKQYRISANAVYPFRMDGGVCLLRFSPAAEKSLESLVAELGFINYLRSRGYPALEPVPTRNGELIVRHDTPWGLYHASVFRRVPGRELGEVSLDQEVLHAYGASLGHLHELSREYPLPEIKRWSHTVVLAWIGKILGETSAPETAFAELALLGRFFANLPKGANNYGLVHFDFELDNVFYDAATGTCHAIDFDDAMYHWYMMDVVQALDSLENDAGIEGDALQAAREAFLAGYRSWSPLDDDSLRQAPAFQRFANLYGYARVLRAVQEKWKHEPEWLVGLRARLDEILKQRSSWFGHPLDN